MTYIYIYISIYLSISLSLYIYIYIYIYIGSARGPPGCPRASGTGRPLCNNINNISYKQIITHGNNNNK